MCQVLPFRMWCCPEILVFLKVGHRLRIEMTFETAHTLLRTPAGRRDSFFIFYLGVLSNGDEQ